MFLSISSLGGGGVVLLLAQVGHRQAGHPGQLHLVQPVLPLGPAGVQEHGVDVQPAGFVLGEVQGGRGAKEANRGSVRKRSKLVISYIPCIKKDFLS